MARQIVDSVIELAGRPGAFTDSQQASQSAPGANTQAGREERMALGLLAPAAIPPKDHPRNALPGN